MALSDERLPDDILGMLDPGSARVARTASRRILSFMNDSARACRYAVEDSGRLQHTTSTTSTGVHERALGKVFGTNGFDRAAHFAKCVRYI